MSQDLPFFAFLHTALVFVELSKWTSTEPAHRAVTQPSPCPALTRLVGTTWLVGISHLVGHHLRPAHLCTHCTCIRSSSSLPRLPACSSAWPGWLRGAVVVVQPSWSCLPWRWLGWKTRSATTGDALVSPKISWLVGIGSRLRCAPSGRGRWSPVEERELEKIRRGEQSQSSRARRAVRGFNLPPTEPRSGGSSYIRRSQILYNTSVNLEILPH